MLDLLESVGGRVCLDFINTVDPRVGASQHDYLASYADLVRWGGHVHLLSEDQMDALLRAAAQHPRAARARFEQAIALRETLYRIFSAVAAQQAPAAADLAAAHTAYVELLAQARLVATGEHYRWQWPAGADALDQPLWSVAQSAMDLLTATELQRVRACPGLGDCGWLFLDTSKSGRRRWCSMEGCGSRAKMRRYYARTHGDADGADRRQDTPAAR
jgi:predicted RNA-binding Zn ribbon-like protein